MTSRLTETDFRDGLAWLRAVLTSNDDGARCVAEHGDPGRVLDAVARLALALRIDADDPVGWIDQTFTAMADILAASAARRKAKEQRDDDAPP